MKIYFAASIRGGREDKEIYSQLIHSLEKHGQVLTEHIGNANLDDLGEKQKTDEFIHDRDLNWLEESEVVIAEVTNVSLGVGYEIGKAECMNKNILCLYRRQFDKKLSAMISGSSKLTVKYYTTIEEANSHIGNFLSGLNFN